MADSVKEYSNGEITVQWRARRCIHFGACTASLPDVYDPDEQPWIKPKNATTEELKAQIAKCPSGALTFSENDKQIKNQTKTNTSVQVLKDGPILERNAIQTTYTDGSEQIKFENRAYCRCGASSNKPFCDTSHTKIDFEAEGYTPEY